MNPLLKLLLCVGLSVLMVEGIGFHLRPAQTSSQKRTAVNRPSPDWKLAVVFKRQKGRRIYVGTVNKPVLPINLSEPARSQKKGVAPPSTNKAIDYEVWLAANGVTRGLWYASAQRVFGDLSAKGQPGPARRDDGTLQRLVSRARPSVAKRPRRIDARAVADFVAAPDTLAELCSRSGVIVVGRVTGILREAHTPINANYENQHTVYVVAVETYLKTDASGTPALRKVWQEGGTLPWQGMVEGEPGGVGYEIEGDPMLDVNSRYILFLYGTSDPGGAFTQLGYVGATIYNVSGKMAELDEYHVADPWRGKILLLNGMTQAPRQTGSLELDHWRFSEPPQILDVPEAEAIAAIQSTCP